MSGDYWIFVDGALEDPVEVCLAVRPLVGESIWYRLGEWDYEVEVVSVAHVAEDSEQDEPARVEIHAVTLSSEEEEEEEEKQEVPQVHVNLDGTINYARCADCHGHEIEQVRGEEPDDQSPISRAAVKDLLYRLRTGQL